MSLVQRDVDTSRDTTQGSRGFDGAVFSVQRDVNKSSRGTTQGSRGSDGAVSLVQRDVDTSRDTTQGSRGFDEAVSLVQRDADASSTQSTKMTGQSPLRDRGSERTVSVQRDVDTFSTLTAEIIRQSSLRDTDSNRVVLVQRDIDESSRDTIGFRDSDEAVSLVQRNIVVAFRGIKTNNNNSLILTPEVEKAFEELKIAFTTAPVLKHFNSELPTRVETDASGYAIDDILSQLHEGV